jgi:glycosyltransferase involved in cell wall biosynthesis
VGVAVVFGLAIMNIQWILDVDPDYGPRHGSNLRYTHFSQGLVAKGHKVYYVLINGNSNYKKGQSDYLETLRSEGCFTDCIQLERKTAPPMKSKLSRLAIYPGFQQKVLASSQIELRNQILDLSKRWAIEISIVSDRTCLFLLPFLSTLSTTIIDWCDSDVLFVIREIWLLAKKGQYSALPCRLKELVFSLMDESYYGRDSVANIIVAHADKKVFDWLNGKPFVNRLLQNGVEPYGDNSTVITKDHNRLIFSGTMDFSPNYDGALWFIEKVMPLLIRKRRSIRLAIAGQKPIPSLLKCATENVEVMGFVPNLQKEIRRSQLYVAPLISGSGFRNKVVEAIASGTYVIGTPMALECLDEKLRNTLLVARSAEEFAARIEEFLGNPQAFNDRLCEAMRFVREEYQWGRKVKELEALCYQALHYGSEVTG